MEFINFLRDEPVMGWFVFLALLVTVVPLVSVLWRRLFGRSQAEVKKQPVRETNSTHFGNQTELVILLVGLMLLLVGVILLRALFGWIRSAFFG